MTREKLIGELDAATTLPGVANIWTQPIINRINMLTTGIRSEVGVKIFGSDLKVLEERARAVAEVLRRIPGAADVYPEQVTGRPVPRHPRQPRGGGALWHHGRRHPGRHRDGRGRDEPDADHRRAPALPRARALCAAVPRQSRGAGQRAWCRPRTARRCPWGSWRRSGR